MNKKYDLPLLLLYFVIILFGFGILYIVSSFSLTTPLLHFKKQLIWFYITLLLGICILQIDNRWFSTIFIYWGWILSLLLMITTTFLGTSVSGHNAWLKLGNVNFQPGEFIKMTTSLAMAFCFKNDMVTINNRKTRFKIYAIILCSVFTVFLQHDFGTLLTFCAFVIPLYREGFNPYIILITAILLIDLILGIIYPINVIIFFVVVISCILIYFCKNIKDFVLLLCSGITFIFVYMCGRIIAYNILKPYHIERIKVLFNSDMNVFNNGWNIFQSKLAIGAGGLWGNGLENATQTKYGFVPVQLKDFIFCTIGEVGGWVFSSIFIITYISFIIRIIQIAERQTLRIYRVYDYCVAGLIFVHFFINIGMTIGLLPVIGIPLPFISYGGSSLLTFSLMIFIVLKMDHQNSDY